MTTIRWRNVAWSFAVLAAIGAACVWGPVFAHERQLREESRLAHLAAAAVLDRSGFWPCDQSSDQYSEQRFAPAPETTRGLVISVYPSFHKSWRVSLAGNHVKLVESRGWRPRQPPELTGRGWIEARAPRLIEAEADIDPLRARRIQAQFKQSLVYDHAQPIRFADGTVHRVRMDGACFETWAAEPSSGASRLMAIGEMLALHASRGAERDAGRSQRAIDILLASFEHGDGTDMMGFAERADPDRIIYTLGPEWHGKLQDPEPRRPD